MLFHMLCSSIARTVLRAVSACPGSGSGHPHTTQYASPMVCEKDSSTRSYQCHAEDSESSVFCLRGFRRHAKRLPQLFPRQFEREAGVGGL